MDTYIPVVEGCQAASPDSGSITALPAEQEWNNNLGEDKGIRRKLFDECLIFIPLLVTADVRLREISAMAVSIATYTSERSPPALAAD